MKTEKQITKANLKVTRQVNKSGLGSRKYLCSSGSCLCFRAARAPQAVRLLKAAAPTLTIGQVKQKKRSHKLPIIKVKLQAIHLCYFESVSGSCFFLRRLRLQGAKNMRITRYWTMKWRTIS